MPGVHGMPKGPPHPVPLPRWGEGINFGRVGKWLASVLATAMAVANSMAGLWPPLPWWERAGVRGKAAGRRIRKKKFAAGAVLASNPVD